jgi:hypothetical protein
MKFARWTFAGALTIAMLQGQTSVREAYATVPGARIFYRDTGGGGAPVILLHAATGSSRVWEYQIPAFTAAGYRVIAFDRRGWGRTEIDSTESQRPLEMRSAADDLLGLLDQLHFELPNSSAGDPLGGRASVTHRSGPALPKPSLARSRTLDVCLHLHSYAKPRRKSSPMKRRAAVASLLASARTLTRHLRSTPSLISRSLKSIQYP